MYGTTCHRAVTRLFVICLRTREKEKTFRLTGDSTMQELTTHERMTRMYRHREADRVRVTDWIWESTLARCCAS